MKRKLIAAIGVAGMMVSVAACGSDDSGLRQGRGAQGADRLAHGRRAEQLAGAGQGRRTTPFRGKHPGIKIKPRVLRVDRTRTPSSTPSSPPTRCPTWSRWATPRCSATWSRAPSLPSTPAKFDNSGAWLDGLKASVTYNGKTYGVPYYAGGRVGNWRKDVAASAGVKTPPKTYGRTDRRPRQDPEEEGRQVLRLVPAQPRLVRGHVLRLRRRRLHRQGGRRQVEGHPLRRPSPSRASRSSRSPSTRTCTATRPRTSPTATSSTARASPRMIFGAAWEGGDRRRPEERQDRQAQGQPRELRDARPVRQEPARLPRRLRPGHPGQVQGAGRRRRVDQRASPAAPARRA